MIFFLSENHFFSQEVTQILYNFDIDICIINPIQDEGGQKSPLPVFPL